MPSLRNYAAPPVEPSFPGWRNGQMPTQAIAQGLVENAPGAEIAVAVRDSYTLGKAIGPALREGRYADAMRAFVESTAAALSALPAVPSLAGVIKAYHGSPHTFDRFSMEKIGTGEGAQAYGHGLYFAEREGVAQGYRDRLASSPNDPEHLAAFAEKDAGSREAAIQRLSADSQAMGDPLGRATLERLRDPRPLSEPAGSLYTTRLNVEPEDLLDWDKPLSEWPRAREIIDRMPLRPESKRELLEGTVEYTGGDLYRQLVKELEPPLPPDPPGTPAGWGFVQRGNEGQPAASRALHEAGIPGIRFLDAGSRNKAAIAPPAEVEMLDGSIGWKVDSPTGERRFTDKAEADEFYETVKLQGEGTRNIVLFDDSLVEITHRNGEPVPSAADVARSAVSRLGDPDAWMVP